MKEFLSQRGVPFELRNVTLDTSAREEFIRAGFLLPPVTVIDGTVVLGYDPERLERLLES